MEQKDDIFCQIVSYKNLYSAYEKARAGKTLRSYVIEFEKDLKQNILDLQSELIFHTYKPRPLTTFIISDPKTRKISKSDFRDRIVHHAICNIIEPIFDKSFIFDSYANRKGKGTLKAVERFDFFKRKVSNNCFRECYVLKVDIKHYFETVDNEILIFLIMKKINDQRVIWLIKLILDNYSLSYGRMGMPLGNLTSQFFANIYLNELDHYIKEQLNIKYYIRYVDDFVILSKNKLILEYYKNKIEEFLKARLELELHPDKSKILKLSEGVNFLGFRIFMQFKLIRKNNLRKFENKFNALKIDYNNDLIEREKIIEKFEGWIAYIKNADTYKYRKHITRIFNRNFPIEKQKPIENIKKHQNFIKKTQEADYIFTTQKTLKLFKKGLGIKKIAEQRQIKESTVWEHIAKLIEYGQLNVWKILPKYKILKILSNIKSKDDKLKEIKERINGNYIEFKEINWVLASVKHENKKRTMSQNFNWYKKVHCFRKCFLNINQRDKCSNKFNIFASKSQDLEMDKNEFLEFFNNHTNICVLPENDKLSYISWNDFVKKHKFSKSVVTPL